MSVDTSYISGEEDEGQWNDYFNEARAHQEVNDGHNPDPEETTLGRWIKKQYDISRRKRKSSTQKSRIRRLYEAGILKRPKKLKSWTTLFNEVITYRSQHGRLPPNSDELGRWLQRQKYAAANEDPNNLSENTALLQEHGLLRSRRVRHFTRSLFIFFLSTTTTNSLSL